MVLTNKNYLDLRIVIVHQQDKCSLDKNVYDKYFLDTGKLYYRRISVNYPNNFNSKVLSIQNIIKRKLPWYDHIKIVYCAKSGKWTPV